MLGWKWYTGDMKKVIIFDFDGVIIDSSKEAYKLLKKAYPDLNQIQFESLFSGNIFSELQKFGNPKMSIDDLQKEWKNIISLQNARPQLVEGIKEIIEKVSKDFLLVINTASEKEVTTNFLLENNLDYFDGIYGSETSRSKVEKFKVIFNKHNCEAGDCIFITDTIGDVIESSQVGIATILVSWGYQSIDLFNKVKPGVVGIANTPEELFTTLEDLAK